MLHVPTATWGLCGCSSPMGPLTTCQMGPGTPPLWMTAVDIDGQGSGCSGKEEVGGGVGSTTQRWATTTMDNTHNIQTEQGTGWRKMAVALTTMVGLAQRWPLWMGCPQQENRRGNLWRWWWDIDVRWGGNKNQQEDYHLANGGIFWQKRYCSQWAASTRKTEGKWWAEQLWQQQLNLGQWAVTYLRAQTEDLQPWQATTNKRQEQTNGT